MFKKALHICKVKTLETCGHYHMPSFCLGWEHGSLTTPLTTKLRRCSNQNRRQSIQGRRPTFRFVSVFMAPDITHRKFVFIIVVGS